MESRAEPDTTATAPLEMAGRHLSAIRDIFDSRLDLDLYGVEAYRLYGVHCDAVRALERRAGPDVTAAASALQALAAMACDREQRADEVRAVTWRAIAEHARRAAAALARHAGCDASARFAGCPAHAVAAGCTVGTALLAARAVRDRLGGAVLIQVWVLPADREAIRVDHFDGSRPWRQIGQGPDADTITQAAQAYLARQTGE